MPEPYFLVVEEINRGNCAQIFGDLFQLLDRNKDGYSKYEIAADDDIRKFLCSDIEVGFGGLTEKQKKQFLKESIWKGKELILPPNLRIWATMNTSDQSLFPIDSAFKRRWEWKYVKITNGYEKDDEGKYKLKDGEKIPLNWKIETNGQDWYGFIQQINKIISNMTSSADKQLGYFFCLADKDGIISTETFVSKVLFYLWNDVFKDYGFEDAGLFKYMKKEGDKEVEEDLTFPDFYDEDGNAVDYVVKQFIEHVMDWRGDDKKDNS
jgi:5-methylcytosine-specific restriction endonuclease McrBC GTP-binding regulatory subunit McrB